MARRTFLAGAMALALPACSAQPPAAIAVSEAWTREIAPGQGAAAIYLTIANTGEGGDVLETVESPQGTASLHSSSSEGGVARMRPLDALPIAGGETVKLEPGGTHIMLTGRTDRPSAGQSIRLTLGFEKSGKRPVAVRVVPAAAGNPHSGHGM